MGFTKTNIKGGLPESGGLEQFSDLRGGLGKNEEVVLLRGVDAPITLWEVVAQHFFWSTVAVGISKNFKT